jgi:hypothetical protein
MSIPILPIPAGKYTCDKLMQPLNTLVEALVTLYGISIEVKFTQSINALPPIRVTLFGIFI